MSGGLIVENVSRTFPGVRGGKPTLALQQPEGFCASFWQVRATI